MARYRLSRIADQKIESIYEYSILRFGEAQADSYFLGLHDLFELLASNPLMGQEEPELGDGIRRFLYEAHIVFYRPMSDGVLILDLKGVRQR
ncbi:MAG: type II toxin-antitoxin system RelE/ParE family toxin [Rhizobiaceae bacterium]|nr:MAG: type II toxin-antitoxin system RelE/ParE family toxin [Rhizobiaceae bacterium]